MECILGTADGDAATMETQVKTISLKSPHKAGCTGGGNAVTRARGTTGEPEDRGRARGKAQPDGAEGAGRAMSDQGVAGGTREPGGATWPMVSGGTERGKG